MEELSFKQVGIAVGIFLLFLNAASVFISIFAVFRTQKSEVSFSSEYVTKQEFELSRQADQLAVQALKETMDSLSNLIIRDTTELFTKVNDAREKLAATVADVDNLILLTGQVNSSIQQLSRELNK
jgi:hypothetical protein